MKAIWNGAVLAESDATVTLNGAVYFPSDSVHREYFVPSDTSEKTDLGTATHYTVMVEGLECVDGAWTYEKPTPEAIESVGTDFTDYVAFGSDVEVI